MKILFIKEKRSPSGIEGIAVYLLNVCIELNKLNIAYLVLYNSKDQFYERLLKNNINVKIVDLLPSSAKNMFNKRNKVKEMQSLIHDIVIKEKITHINVHFPHLLNYLKKSWGVPIIAHWHGAFVNNKPLKYFYLKDIFNFRNCINNFYTKLVVFNFSRADRVICPSVAAQNTAKICFNVSNNKMEINSYGLKAIKSDAYKSLRTELGFNKEDKIILSVGRETKSKGVEEFCQIADFLSNEKGYKFVFLGGYKDKSYHDSLVKKYGKVVKFMGHREDVYDFYKTADLFLFLSHRESAGLILAEAMFFSLPLITWNIIGVNEMFKNEVNGYLVEFGNTQQVVSLIEKVLENKDLHNRLSLASYQESKKHLIENSVSQLIKIFRRIA